MIEGEIVIKIYGASDDLVEIEMDTEDGTRVFEEIAEGDEVRVIDMLTQVCNLGHAHETGKAGVGVRMVFTDHGWEARIRPIGQEIDENDDASLPWPVRIEAEKYSPAVLIECPTTAHLEWDKHA